MKGQIYLLNGTLVAKYIGSNPEYRVTQMKLALRKSDIKKFNLKDGDIIYYGGRLYERIEIERKE